MAPFSQSMSPWRATATHFMPKSTIINVSKTCPKDQPGLRPTRPPCQTSSEGPPDLPDVQRVGRTLQMPPNRPSLTGLPSAEPGFDRFGKLARPAGRPAGRAGIPQEPALARPASHPACLRGLRPAQGIWLSGLAKLLAISFPNLFNK